MNTVYLVRHGENQANLTKEFSCRKVDYPLTPKGRLQAQQTADYFRGMDIHAVYASPLKRAIETAEYIAKALGLEVRVMENFREVDVGQLEDLPPTAENWAIHMAVFYDWIAGKKESRFPGGENYYEALERMQAGLSAVLGDENGRNYVIVAHGGIMLPALDSLCSNMNLRERVKQDNHNCSITRVEFEKQDGGLKGLLLDWANYTHLHGEAAELVSGFPDSTEGDPAGRPD